MQVDRVQQIIWEAGCGCKESMVQLAESMRDVIKHTIVQNITYTGIADDTDLPPNATPHVIYHHVETARRHFKDVRVDVIMRMLEVLTMHIAKDLNDISEANEILLNRFDVSVVDDYTPANENHAQEQDLLRIECRVFIVLLPKTQEDK